MTDIWFFFALQSSSSTLARHTFKPDCECYSLSIARQELNGKLLMAAGFTDGSHRLWDINAMVGVGAPAVLSEPALVVPDSVELSPVDVALVGNPT